MVKATLLLCAALVASAAALPMLPLQRAFPAERPPRTAAADRVGESPCLFCERMVLSVTDFLNDPDTQLRLATAIDNSVCTQLPPSFADTCRQEVPPLLKQAAQAVREAATPADVCQMFGACGATLSLSNPWQSAQAVAMQQALKLGGPLDCPVCKMLVLTLIARLQEPQYRSKIEADAHAACRSLAQEDQPKCHADVDAFFSELNSLMNDVDPQRVCQLVDYCATGPLTPAKPDGAVRLGELLSQLASTPRYTFPDAQPGSLAAASNRLQESGCDTCKTIVMEVAAILADPKTQVQLMEYAKEGCEVFQDFKDQCVQYVTLYGPLVINMAITYLQPDPLCIRLGYCPLPPPPIEPVLVVS